MPPKYQIGQRVWLAELKEEGEVLPRELGTVIGYQDAPSKTYTVQVDEEYRQPAVDMIDDGIREVPEYMIEDTTVLEFWSVAIYLVDKRYGGPEEGGWWYDCGERLPGEDFVDHVGPLLALSQSFLSEDAACEHAGMVNEALETLNRGRRPISSVASEGRYYAMVKDGPVPPPYYPAQRPHYE